MESMADIRLYVACHKPVSLPQHPCLTPVQAGSAFAAQYIADMLHDDAGEHISAQNPSYCELTVQYWAWKNQKADYYGFFHYRRFMSFQPKRNEVCKVYLEPNEKILQQNGYDLQSLQQFVTEYDVIVPCAEETTETVYQKYANAPHHYAEDMNLMIALIEQYQPEYKTAMDQYLHGHKQYYFNMYVMKQEWFYRYCEWLFSLLKQFDQSNNRAKYNNDKVAMRVDGYLAERLFGIWYTYQLHQNTIHSIEVPWLYFAMGDKKMYCKQRLKNILLPPGSKRKRIITNLRKS